MRAGFAARIKLRRSTEKLTSHGGFVLLSELWDGLGISRLVDGSLPQPGSGRAFKQSEMVRSIVCLLHKGGEHLSDISHHADDEVLLRLNGLRKFPAPNSLTEWLRNCERMVNYGDVSRRENVVLHGLEDVNRELLGILARKLKRTRLTLDIDATVVKTGKRTARITYKKYRGCQPQLAYLSELRAFVVSEFRNGDEPSAKDVVPYLERCRANMPKGTDIGTVRADAAYYQRCVLKWCIENGSNIAIRARRDVEVLRVISEIPENAWAPYFDADGIEQSDTKVASTDHSMSGVGWFRLLVLRRRRNRGEQLDIFDGKYSYWPIATNLTGSAQDVIHFYNQRGRMEDGIGQLKADCGLSRMPCSDLKANAVWIAIGILAFTIFALFKSLVLGGEWAVKKAKAVRFHILNVPGKLVRHAREFVLKLGCSAEFLDFMRESRLRCRRLASEYG